MRRRRATGGWYCTECGWTTLRLPGGAIHCGACGKLGLRGFHRHYPYRIRCAVEGCSWQGWDDGGVNNDIGEHMRREHAELATAGRCVQCGVVGCTCGGR